MEFALAMRHLWRHRLWLIPVALLSVLAALAVIYTPSLFPPSLKSKSLEYGAANGQVLVQPVQPTALAEITTSSTVPPAQVALYAALLQTQPLRQAIGREAKLPWPALAVEGQTTAEPKAAQRSTELVNAGRALSLFYTVEPATPIINLYAQAPEAQTAHRIVTAATAALKSYVRKLQRQGDVPKGQEMRLIALGKPQAGTLASGADLSMGLLVGIFVFIGGCLLIIFVPRFALALRRAGALEESMGTTVPVPAIPPHEAIEANGNGNGNGHELNAPQKHLTQPD